MALTNSVSGSLSNGTKRFLMSGLDKLTIASVSAQFIRDTSVSIVRLGSDYGGWWIPRNTLSGDYENPVLISVGLGHDVSFDRKFLEGNGYLIGLDPLATSIRYAERELSHCDRKHLLRMGLWKSDGEVAFFPPEKEGHDSWSITEPGSISGQVEKFQVTTLASLVHTYPEINESDFLILKLDIEGAEFEVLKSGGLELMRPNYLAVEIDYLSKLSFFSFSLRIKRVIRVRKLLHQLKNLGYELIHTEHYNFFWILR